MKTIIYPGTFDPLTHGHTDLIDRASNIFDKVILAIAKNPKKNTLFTLEKRIELATQVLQKNKKVEVRGFSNLLIDFARECDAHLILRGLRAISDYEHEFQLANMNRRLDATIETLFLTPSEQYAYLSSSLIKEIASLGGDISQFVDPIIAIAIKNLKSR